MSESSNIPIAIIGVGCRFPGGAQSAQKLWDILSAGTNTWSHVPTDRYNEEAFLNRSPDDPNGSHNHLGGHFLTDDIRDFDNDFFSISSQEAAAMDPQQRILLETVYEALESAGQQQHQIRGSETSVHVALFTHDYDRAIFKDTLDVPRYQTVGTGDAIAANRISHVFDFRGPSITLDTGCSGSLVAVHQACNSLKLGECDMAVAAAANLIIGPDHQIGMSNIHMLGDDGRSYPFDSRGSGYGRGEGFASLVLKRLDKAIEAGDPIRAVVLGSAVNQDGRTIQGITYPSGAAQAALEKRLYQQLNLDPLSISYVEAHGTGTVAGDREEIDALAEVFCKGRTTPLYVGSIKSNIGHLEGSSGLAGLIKALVSLEHGQIPPNADFRKEKDGLRLHERNIKIPTVLEAWPQSDKPRASVNSFGYGGTNAHLVLERAPQADHKPDPATQSSPHLFVISAKSRTSLTGMIEQYRTWTTESGTGFSLASLSHTLCNRRSHYPWRFSCVATDHSSLIDQLAHFTGPTTANANAGDVPLNFIFTGQGAQWPRMGRELLLAKQSSAFTDSMHRSRDILLALGATWDLIQEVLHESGMSRIHEAELAQPATTAIQIALVDLLRSMGVVPNAVIGHSSGEVAAAYAANYITQPDALRVAYSRGLVPGISRQKGLPKGAMMAVGLAEDEVLKHINKLTKGTVSVACVNSPQNTTVSGDEEAIDELAATLSSLDIFNRKLLVDTAYHSHHMRAAVDEYKQLMGSVQTQAQTTPVRFFSTVTGLEKSSEFDADYWSENLTSKVRFRQALQLLCSTQTSRRIFIEIGPHNALAGPTRQCITDLSQSWEYDYISPLRRGTNAVQSVLEVAGKLFERGSFTNFSVVSALDPVQEEVTVLHDLPSYSWNHSKKHWHESRLSRDYRLRKHPYHDLLGMKGLEPTSFQPTWRHMISITSLPWLADHVVDGVIVFPGSGYLCMAIEAISQLAQDRSPHEHSSRITLRDVEFLKALLVPDSPQKTEVQITFSAVGSGTHQSTDLHYQFRVAAYNKDQTWDEHCRGYIEIDFPQGEDKATKANGVVKEFANGLSNGVSNGLANGLVNGTANGLSNGVSNGLTNGLANGLANGLSREKESSQRKVIPSQELYEQLREHGNAYGSIFAGIENMTIDGDRSIATVAIPKVAEIMPSNHVQPHIIHPTTLDIVMHTSLPLAAQKFGPGPIMPVHISELIVSNKVNNTPGSTISVHTEIVSTNLRTAEVDIDVFNDHEGGSNLSFSGLRLRSLATSSSVKETQHEAGNSCWDLSWNLDVDFLTAESFERAVAGSGDSLSWKEKLQILNDVSAFHIKKCLDAIDEKHLQITDEYLPLVDWMRREGGRDSNGSSELQDPSLNTYQFSEMDIVARTGEQLSEIVSGKVNALQLVIEDDLLYRSYTDHSSALCQDLMAQYVKSLVFKKSKLRVLEVGGGSGSATLPFLQAMKTAGFSPAAYDFTDVSTGFFDRAASKLSEYPMINYKRLDIEKEPAQQGFEPGSYDVVLAFNCLHVTDSIRTTLRNARSLLRPDGRLILIEIVNSQPYHHISYGTLAGYWKGAVDGRPDGPFMPEDQWRQAFIDTNLELQLCKQDDESAHISSLMIARPLENTAPRLETLIQILRVAGSDDNFASQLLAALKSLGYNAVVKNFGEDSDDDTTIKIVLDDGDSPLLSKVTPETFQSLCTMINKQSRILWVSGSQNPSSFKDPRKHLITGLARSAQAENDNLRFVTVDLQQGLTDADSQTLALLVKCLQSSLLQLNPSSEREYVIREDTIQIPRLTSSNVLREWMSRSSQTEEYKFNTSALTLLNNDANGFVFTTDETHQIPIATGEIELQVQALSRPYYSFDSGYHEYSGTVTSLGTGVEGLQIGDRVVAIGKSSYASNPRVFARHAHRIPDNMSFITAAALPLALMSAYHVLFDLVDISQSQTILLHGVNNIINQAILLIARSQGIRVLVTASGSLDQSLLKKQFKLPEDCIVEWDTKKARHQQKTIEGIDAIISSDLTSIPSSITAKLNPFGTIVHLQGGAKKKADLSYRFQLPANATLHTSDIDIFLQAKPKKADPLFKQVFDFITTTGLSFSELSLSVKPIEEIGEVIRLADSLGSSGKTVLEVRTSSTVPTIKSAFQFNLDSNATFVIAGGLGDVGQKLLSLLARHGARHFVTLSRRSPKEDVYQKLAANSPINCEFHHIQCDVSRAEDVKAAVAAINAKGLPPVRGIIQSTLMLQDRTLDSMTLHDFEVPLDTKMKGTLNLEQAFETAQLDFFIMLSSAANIVGTSGQANYNAGNSVQDALAHMSKSKKCHYLTFNLGMVQGTGHIEDHDTRNNWLYRAGLKMIQQSSLDRMLEYILSPTARVDRLPQIVAGFDPQSLARAESANGTIRSPLFAHVLEPIVVEQKQETITKKKTFKEILETDGPEAALAFTTTAVSAKLASLTSIDADSMDLDKAIVDFGLDSLIAIELRNWIKREFKASLQSLEILNEQSIRLLAKKIISRAG
ncbi:ketoacyl-synt-domain-containing protein [Pleomassaria siparia CBS 279.74]|uniref:Ketoacyl-synt-domain-containing protein n=1 Tax=Pleomassaria siparia CBS 279.74 TaxID=1314801 RepID=A0A6G1KLW5_9PLEO|nr:ketoacyl-synt-domain-containing protein [Pleomassaria siparia CBS 279.74]